MTTLLIINFASACFLVMLAVAYISNKFFTEKKRDTMGKPESMQYDIVADDQVGHQKAIKNEVEVGCSLDNAMKAEVSSFKPGSDEGLNKMYQKGMEDGAKFASIASKKLVTVPRAVVTASGAVVDEKIIAATAEAFGNSEKSISDMTHEEIFDLARKAGTIFASSQ
jgi:hypothetical protein